MAGPGYDSGGKDGMTGPGAGLIQYGNTGLSPIYITRSLLSILIYRFSHLS